MSGNSYERVTLGSLAHVEGIKGNQLITCFHSKLLFMIILYIYK